MTGKRQVGIVDDDPGVSDSLSLLFAVGHAFGPARPDHEQLLFYLGLQVQR